MLQDWKQERDHYYFSDWRLFWYFEPKTTATTISFRWATVGFQKMGLQIGQALVNGKYIVCGLQSKLQRGGEQRWKSNHNWERHFESEGVKVAAVRKSEKGDVRPFLKQSPLKWSFLSIF